MSATATATAQAHARDERLRWHCRRALLELDIVFSRFWAAQGEQRLTAAEADSLKRLLALEDHPLWDLVNGSKDMEMSREDAALLSRLRCL
jgi:antitoxin CptB